MRMSKFFNHFIDGRKQEGTNHFAVINPATGDIFGEAAQGTQDDIDNAVDVARRTFRASTWRDLDGRLRGNLLRQIGRMIRKHVQGEMVGIFGRHKTIFKSGRFVEEVRLVTANTPLAT